MPASVELKVLDEFFADASVATNTEGLNKALKKAVGNLGFDRMNVSVLRDYGLPPSHEQFALNCNYPDAWLHHYQDRGYIDIDPVAQNARHDAEPFFWTALPNLQRQQLAFFGEAEDFGLHNGVGLPFLGAPGLRGGIALATSDRAMEHSKRLDLLSAVASFYYLKFKLFVVGEHARQIQLPPQEAKVASMLFAGKTNREISKLLGSSKHTINMQVRHIFHKLDANSRVGAVLHALCYGIFDPYSTNE